MDKANGVGTNHPSVGKVYDWGMFEEIIVAVYPPGTEEPTDDDDEMGSFSDHISQMLRRFRAMAVDVLPPEDRIQYENTGELYFSPREGWHNSLMDAHAFLLELKEAFSKAQPGQSDIERLAWLIWHAATFVERTTLRHAFERSVGKHRYVLNGLERGRSQRQAESSEKAKAAQDAIQEMWKKYPKMTLTSARRALAKRQTHGSFESIKRYTKGMKKPSNGAARSK